MRLSHAPLVTEQWAIIFRRTVLLTFLVIVITPTVLAQPCLSSSDLSTLLARAGKPTPTTANTKLEMELIKISAINREAIDDYLNAKDSKKEEYRTKLTANNQKNEARLCEVIKEYGWPTRELVDLEGVHATYEILRNSASYELQRDLLPVVLAAAKRDESQKPEFAALLDRLRVSAGMKQLFGTQAVITQGFLVLYPIEDDAHVDDRRKEYGLSPLEEYKRSLERRYQTPMVNAREAPESKLAGSLRSSVSQALNATDLNTPSVSEEDVIKTNINLVNLNVSVFSKQSRTFVSELNKSDFKVFEDGKQQDVTYFASTDKPFDLVLLIDLSGSTSSKRKLIKESTQKFIGAARPSDRIAIVTFSTTQTVVSPLTEDRAKLLASIEHIEGGGGSNIWDALKFVLDQVVGPSSIDRRRAVVMMTDGVDNAMGNFGMPGIGSTISFADLLSAVAQSDTLVVPIYLDTEKDEPNSQYKAKLYANARRTLQALANESGGSYYTARRVADLEGVYQQVINDLGKIYSIGYQPINDKRDSTWRKVEVEIVNRPDLVTHAKPGYFAK